jgi:hypothetical protein
MVAFSLQLLLGSLCEAKYFRSAWYPNGCGRVQSGVAGETLYTLWYTWYTY